MVCSLQTGYRDAISPDTNSSLLQAQLFLFNEIKNIGSLLLLIISTDYDKVLQMCHETFWNIPKGTKI